MISTRRLALVVVLSIMAAAVASINALAQDQEWQSSQVLGVPPAGADMFQLNDLESFKKYSRVKNFENTVRAPFGGFHWRAEEWDIG